MNTHKNDTMEIGSKINPYTQAKKSSINGKASSITDMVSKLNTSDFNIAPMIINNEESISTKSKDINISPSSLPNDDLDLELLQAMNNRKKAREEEVDKGYLDNLGTFYKFK